MVAGVAYIERVRRAPASFTATLTAEPGNRYFRHAIAVLFEGEKIGYVAPEFAAGIFESVTGASGPIACPARRAAPVDHEASGVEILLDFSALSLATAE
jgi:hypothetical protein